MADKALGDLSVGAAAEIRQGSIDFGSAFCVLPVLVRLLVFKEPANIAETAPRPGTR